MSVVDDVAKAWGQDPEELHEDLCCMFFLARVDANEDGTFNLATEPNGGREMLHVSAARAMAIIAVRWAPGGSRRFHHGKAP